MERDELLREVAPCGLVCHTCVASKHGAVTEHARKLRGYLENFDVFAERMKEHDPRLGKYPVFKEVLQMVCEAGCEGCRDGACKYPGCGISPCAMEKGVDFCFECTAFPCDKADFEPLLKSKWLAANERMREIGAEAYLDEVRNRSHYV